MHQGAGPAYEERYDRMRDLPHLVGLWPADLRDFSSSGSRKIIRRLHTALRAERERGRSGHWTYDLERHLRLARAFKAEIAAFAATDGAAL